VPLHHQRKIKETKNQRKRNIKSGKIDRIKGKYYQNYVNKTQNIQNKYYHTLINEKDHKLTKFVGDASIVYNSLFNNFLLLELNANFY